MHTHMGRWAKVTDQVVAWSEQNFHGPREVLMSVVAHRSLSNRDRADVVLEISSALVLGPSGAIT